MPYVVTVSTRRKKLKLACRLRVRMRVQVNLENLVQVRVLVRDDLKNFCAGTCAVTGRFNKSWCEYGIWKILVRVLVRLRGRTDLESRVRNPYPSMHSGVLLDPKKFLDATTETP